LRASAIIRRSGDRFVCINLAVEDTQSIAIGVLAALADLLVDGERVLFEVSIGKNSQSAVFCLAVACYTLSWREAEDEKRHHQGRKDTWW
jgi:hypothetical protein